MVKIIFLVVILVEAFRSNFAAEQHGAFCTSHQYMELGSPGTLYCDFGEHFFGVFWYNSTDYLSEPQQLIYITNEEKGGAGYLSGEFDIVPNGSLIISNVTFQHNHGYTVIMFKSKTDKTVPIYVNVFVTVKPKQTFPTINECRGEQICLSQIHEPGMLYCYVNDSLPAINLTYVKRTLYGDQQVESDVSLQIGKSLQTSVIGINLPVSEVITLYVCKADQITTLLASDESAVLIQTSDYSTYIPGANIVQSFAKRGSNVELQCSHDSTLYMVWSNRINKTVNDRIAYSISYRGQSVKKMNVRYQLKDDSSLIIPFVTLQDEGMYQCITGNGVKEQVFIFNVTVFASPIPHNLIVDGCSLPDNCVLPVKTTGLLTCRLLKTRPVVSLRWRFVGSISPENKFYNGEMRAVKRDDLTFDITFMSEYTIHESQDNTVTAECFVVAEEGVQLPWLNLSTQVTLLIPSVHAPPNSTQSTRIWIILVCVLVGVIVVFCCVYTTRKRLVDSIRQWHEIQSQTVQGEDLPMMKDGEDQLNTFRRELTKRYKGICETTKLLPNDTTTYCIDDVFVESGLQKMSGSSSAEGIRWIAVESYHKMIDPADKNCDRITVQGESGFGKTLLCRKIAYDWYSRSNDSNFGSLDILIYLPVRLLGGLPLCVAIKQHLLPHDTSLSLKDIKYLLSTCSSVLVFDGFSRFPRDETYKNSELHHILLNQAFQSSHVILTALPDFLPPTCKTAKRMNLVGFNETARGKYIRNIVAKNDPEGQMSLDSFFKSSPDIFQFCHVPLFFALLSNLYYNGKVHNLDDAKRVTEIFESIVSGLAVTEDELNVSKTEDMGSDIDFDLERESFELLANSQTGYRFEKDEIVLKLGDTAYMEYIQMGLLNEDEIVISNTRPNDNYFNVSYRTEVKFYHSIFLEWYAAQYLSRIAEETEWNELKRILDKIEPVNHQYVFRFACGLNEKAAFNIVKYLEQKKDGQKFAKLCIVEQTGSIDKIRVMIEKLCASPVVITEDDSVLLQRSLVQLLELAAKNKIHIEVLWLQELAVSFNNAQEIIEFGQGIKLPRLDTLQQLSISNSVEFTEYEFSGLLTYVSLCKKLMSFRLRGCMLPARIQSDAMSVLIENDVSVEWILPVTRKPRYILNLKSGYWESKKRKMTDKEYERVKTVLGFRG